MDKLALTLPGIGNAIDSPVKDKFTNLGGLLSGLLNIAIYVAALFAFVWLALGAFQYIMAQGKKEELAKARGKIIWALVGLLVVFLAFSLARFVSEILPTKGGLPFIE